MCGVGIFLLADRVCGIVTADVGNGAVLYSAAISDDDRMIDFYQCYAAA